MALPYEIANAVVRTLVLHARKLQTARATFNTLIERDPTMSKEKTLAAKQEVCLLEKGQRYIVMNRRTGQIASMDWLQKNVAVEEGKPVPKNKKMKIWILTLRVQVVSEDRVVLSLSLASGEEHRPLRCFQLSGGEQDALPDLLDGYSHIMEDGEGDALEETHVFLHHFQVPC